MSFGVLINLRRKGIHSLINCRIGLYATGVQVFRLNISLSAFNSNGLIVQWGKKQENTMHVDFPVVFSKCLYFNFIAYRTQSTGNGWHYYNNLTPRGVNVLSEDEGALWIAIGI